MTINARRATRVRRVRALTTSDVVFTIIALNIWLSVWFLVHPHGRYEHGLRFAVVVVGVLLIIWSSLDTAFRRVRRTRHVPCVAKIHHATREWRVRAPSGHPSVGTWTTYWLYWGTDRREARRRLLAEDAVGATLESRIVGPWTPVEDDR